MITQAQKPRKVEIWGSFVVKGRASPSPLAGVCRSPGRGQEEVGFGAFWGFKTHQFCPQQWQHPIHRFAITCWTETTAEGHFEL